MILHKLSDTTKVITFLMVDSTDHLTGKTGLSPTVTKSENGGSFGAVAGTVAEIGLGWYKLTPASGDVDTPGVLLLHATGTAADPVDIAVQVVAFDPYDATALGLSNLNATISSRASQTSVDTIDDFVDTEMAAALAAVDTEVAAIKAKTDNLPADPADASDIAAAVATLQGFVDTEVAAIKAVTDKVDTAMEADGGVYRFTVNALEQGPSGGGGVADWTADERTAIRAILGIPASGTTPDVPSAGALKIIDDFLDTELAAVLAAVDTEVAAIKAKTDNLPASPANEATLTTIVGYLDTEVAATLAAVDTEVAAIKAKTDNLPTDPADESSIQAALTEIKASLQNAKVTVAAGGLTGTIEIYTPGTAQSGGNLLRTIPISRSATDEPFSLARVS